MKYKLLEIPKKDAPLSVSIPALDKYQVEYDFTNKTLAYKAVGKTEAEADYVISKDLITAVNAAIVTGRPLLLRGEPGSGKTKLAKAVAVKLLGEASEVNKYYFEWFVKSKSQAQEGCYSYDHIQRLRDATIPVKGTEKKDISDADNYLSFGPLGKVLLAKPPTGKPILVIDEIDKGDIDFPNDLLLELDELRFTIKEKNNSSIASVNEFPPLVFITSNDERELPPAFLRRCLIYRIPPFGPELLGQIAQGKLEKMYQTLGTTKKQLESKIDVAAIVQKFIDLRKGSVSANPPSTSELLDWLKLIAFKVSNGEAFDKVLEDKGLQALALKIS